MSFCHHFTTTVIMAAWPPTLRALADTIKSEKAYNEYLCAELDEFCASGGKGVELVSFRKLPTSVQVTALRRWCANCDAAFLELCERLDLTHGVHTWLLSVFS